jgi:hypothetical protein
MCRPRCRRALGGHHRGAAVEGIERQHRRALDARRWPGARRSPVGSLAWSRAWRARRWPARAQHRGRGAARSWARSPRAVITRGRGGPRAVRPGARRWGRGRAGRRGRALAITGGVGAVVEIERSTMARGSPRGSTMGPRSSWAPWSRSSARRWPGARPGARRWGRGRAGRRGRARPGARASPGPWRSRCSAGIELGIEHHRGRGAARWRSRGRALGALDDGQGLDDGPGAGRCSAGSPGPWGSLAWSRASSGRNFPALLAQVLDDTAGSAGIEHHRGRAARWRHHRCSRRGPGLDDGRSWAGARWHRAGALLGGHHRACSITGRARSPGPWRAVPRHRAGPRARRWPAVARVVAGVLGLAQGSTLAGAGPGARPGPRARR